MPEDGTTIAIEAPFNEWYRDKSEHLRVFDFNSEHGRWVQRDSDTDDEAPNNEFGWDAALFTVGVCVGAIEINTHVVNIF